MSLALKVKIPYEARLLAMSWNPTRTQLVASFDDCTVKIFDHVDEILAYKQDLYQLGDTAVPVVALDWAKHRPWILGATDTQLAFVWPLETYLNYSVMLLLLRDGSGSLKCEWCPKGRDKALITQKSGILVTVHYHEDNDFWFSKHIKLHTHGILDASFHPNNILIATAGSDGKRCVVSSFIRFIDFPEDITNDAFGTRLPYHTLAYIQDSTAWVTATAWYARNGTLNFSPNLTSWFLPAIADSWPPSLHLNRSPSGNRLLWAFQDATLTVVECTNAATFATFSHRSGHLPFSCLLWVSETQFVAAGNTRSPVLFSWNPLTHRLEDDGTPLELAYAHSTTTEHVDAMAVIDSKCSDSGVYIGRYHATDIREMKAMRSQEGQITSIYTLDKAGGLVVWTIEPPNSPSDPYNSNMLDDCDNAPPS